MILANIHTSSQASMSNIVASKRDHYLLLYAYRAFCTQSYGIVFYRILGMVSSNPRKITELNEQKRLWYLENYTKLIEGKSSTHGLKRALGSLLSRCSKWKKKKKVAYHFWSHLLHIIPKTAGGPHGLRLSHCTFWPWATEALFVSYSHSTGATGLTVSFYHFTTSRGPNISFLSQHCR